MISGFLEMRGFHIIHAASIAEAASRSSQREVSVVLSAVNLASAEAGRLLTSLQRAGEAPLTLVALLDREGQRPLLAQPGFAFSAQVVRAHRDALLASLHQHLEPLQIEAEAA
jgi:DNA-binding NtrC family response regulator